MQSLDLRAPAQTTASTMHRDPAPSRAAYRMHRLWLTPTFRRLLRLGIPTLLVGGLIAGYFGQADNREAVVDKIAEIRRSIEDRPEFRVNLMAIDGASVSTAHDIREIIPIDFPLSSFDLDLVGMQARVAELDAVEQVDIHIAQGGVLGIKITERQPAAIWRVGSELELLDAVGHRVALVKSRTDRPELPLLAGEGAEFHVPEALELLDAAGPVANRIRGLVRMGERRWDVVLDRGQRILLPEQGAVSALLQVMALEQAQSLLARSIIAVDMRHQKRPTLRLAADALDELHEVRGTVLGADN